MADYVKFEAYVTTKNGTVFEVKYELNNSTTMYIDEDDLHPDFAAMTPNITTKQNIIGKKDGKITAIKSIKAEVDDSVKKQFIKDPAIGIQYAKMTFAILAQGEAKAGGTGTGGSGQGIVTGIGSYNG